MYSGFALVGFAFYRATHGGSVEDRWPNLGFLCILLGAAVQMFWTAPVAPGPYAAAWKSYQRGSLVISIPATVGVTLFLLLFYRLARDLPPVWAAAMVVCCGFAALANFFWFQWWPCPRCGEAFFVRGWPPHWPVVRRCLHCGLPKWAAGPPAEDEDD